jgi:hypothetical protein
LRPEGRALSGGYVRSRNMRIAWERPYRGQPLIGVRRTPDSRHESALALRGRGPSPDDGPVTTDADCVEAFVDYGNVPGYLVRLNVEIPKDATAGNREDGGPMGMLLLTHDEAESLAHQLLAVAAEGRRLRDDRPGGRGFVQL